MSDVTFQTITNADYCFKVDVPSTWEDKTADEHNKGAEVVRFTGSNETSNCLFLVFWNSNMGVSPREAAEQNETGLRANGYESFAHHELSLTDQRIAQLNFNKKMGKGREWSVRHYYISYEDDMVVLGMGTDSMTRDGAVFDHIVSSFKFIAAPDKKRKHEPKFAVEISEDQFALVEPLFDRNTPNHPMLFSVLERRNPGNVFVDTIDRPSAGLVLTNSGTAFFGGDVRQTFVDQAILKARSKRAAIVIRSDEQDLPLPEPTVKIERLEFRSCGSRKGNFELSSGCTVREMDEDILTRCNWKLQAIQSFGSIEGFLANGFGLCLMQGDEILSEAYALYVMQGEFELARIAHSRRIWRFRGDV